MIMLLLFVQLYSRCYQLKMNFFTVTSAIHGYQVYKDIWDTVADINEELHCERETDNPRDSFAVAVKKVDTIISHIPRHTYIQHLFHVYSERCGYYM